MHGAGNDFIVIDGTTQNQVNSILRYGANLLIANSGLVLIKFC
jgi:diaminopimelate epimerase